MKQFIKKITASKALVYLLYLFARGYLLTVTIKIKNEKTWQDQIKKGDPILICMFHQQFFFIVRFFRKYLIHNPCIMISRSRDGDIGTMAAKFSGCAVARGSSSKGGKKAMTEMIEYLASKKGFCINLVDGPQGPIGVVKPGSIRIAQKAGAGIVPAYFISNHIWQVNSWDGFVIPKPFSRVTLKFGEMITMDSIQSEQEFESMRLKVETIMAPYLFRKN
ncbi:MAG: lysophospholipid acyltransferase family protein [Proteobacteria bacterium]|nr:lysophospholipid acyltransferase family protein [Pseudomonadota bacterium]MBU1584968.1 lysophospholipid acyltransferase family protein [Pseudomonadota bacterium]MBU2454881.1 lysophospholipid acyltransferase family protein [Pseudomonadota bacterium]MBU2630545.1 lysophospholipid acyltransferase family protein [Pseudomonadota bacterium]